MAAGKLDLKIEKGATFKHRLYMKDASKNPIDLTGFTARMQIRSSASASSIIVELTTENGRIAITAGAGQIDLYISDEDTTAITHKGTAVYDLELEDSLGDVTKLTRGVVSFEEEVTY